MNEINCIIQNDIRYCEEEEMTSTDSGLWLLMTVAIIVYIIVLIELDFYFNWFTWKILIPWILIPIALLWIYLII